MNYTIDKSLEFANAITFKSESGVEYRLYLAETAPGSRLWTFGFQLISGNPNQKEVFGTIGLIQKLLLEKNGLIEKNNISEIVLTIDGKNRDEVDKKTKIFTRWIKSPWEFEITRNPVISIQGKMENIYLDTNLIHIKKSTIVEQINSETKFCFNCGTENKKDYKFCPNCGQNLQQA